MVVSEVSILDVPPLPGNPFDIRPIERSRAHEMVGCEGLLSTWREHMHAQSPRMVLLVGERGSGRTSLVNSLSSQTNHHFRGYLWHEEDPVNRFLSELSVTFCGHNLPNSMHQTVENLVESLDSLTGPLPLIVVDYPSDIEMSDFLVSVSPILQRLRAFVVVTLTNAQLSSMDEGTRALFHPPEQVPSLSEGQIQLLCDSRLRRMTRERWKLHPRLISSIHSLTSGNPRQALSLLRDLLDEKRGLGSDGTLERLVKWERPIPQERQEISEFEPENTLGDWSEDPEIEDDGEEIREESEVLQEDWDVEPDDLWEEEAEDTDEEGEPETSEDEVVIYEEELPEIEPDSSRITDWNPESDSILTMDEGTEPPSLSTPSRGFSGLLHRTRNASDTMDTSPDNNPVVDTSEILERETPEESLPTRPETKDPEKAPLGEIVSTEPRPPDYLGVLSTDGEQWTVDSDLEETLPEPSEGPDDEVLDEVGILEPQFEEANSEAETIKETLSYQYLEPSWDSSESIDEGHLRAMNDAERLVVSIAAEREISPSDAEIQARLEVGRPRLSQIYNSLYRSGILSARKQGRSRLFKLSEMASELIS